MSAEQVTEDLCRVAEALGPALRQRLVFLGGAACSLLLTDGRRQPPRPTGDVDVAVKLGGQVDYYDLQRQLNERGFYEDTSSSVVCRFRHDDLILDVVPTDSTILGFANRWHEYAVESAASLEIAGTGDSQPFSIRVVTAPCFVASKLESYGSRGQGDLDHWDIEDIIAVIDGRPTLASELAGEREDLRRYVRDQMKSLLAQGLEDKVASHLRGDASSQARAPLVVATCRVIAGALEKKKTATVEPPPKSSVLWTIHVTEGAPRYLWVNCWLEPRVRALEPFFNGNQAPLPLGSLTDALRQAVTIVWGGAQPTVIGHPDVDRATPYRRATDHISRAPRPTGTPGAPTTLRWQREIHAPNGMLSGPGADVKVASTMEGALRAIDDAADRIATGRVLDALTAKAAWDL